MTWDHEADLIVVGSGNGGMSAAVAAAKNGADVLVLEVSGATGGGSSWSGGGLHIWGVRTYDEYRALTQDLHDRQLGRVFFEAFTQYSPWLQEIGAAVTKSPYLPDGKYDLHMGRDVTGPPFSAYCREYFDSLERILEECGGRVILGTRVTEVLTDEAGTVIGVAATGPEGRVRCRADAVVLACGGFQNNPEMRVRYLGPDADLATILGCPYQTGDGMRMAETAGGSLGGSMSTFSAVWMSAFPARNPAEDPAEYERRPYTLDGKYELSDHCIVFEPPGSILVNLDGRRFIDEAETYYRVPQAVIKQRRATAVMLCDATVWEPWANQPNLFTGRTPREQFRTMERAGGILLTAMTIEDLADQLAGLTPNRVHKANLLRTIAGYNEAVRNGTAAQMEVPRTAAMTSAGTMNAPALLEKPPFYAWPLRPAIYMCYGGVRINEHAQVLDAGSQPVPGLYAVPPVAGGVFREVYAGGISCAGAFGWIAGRHATARMS
ncbi:FAD-dependent oxidoreductase [Mycobacterium sp. E1747]|uniref:FAD-dependent oxidoreductase n=1 Tax=Mycobacterium sp. E1747 TaxID=1834128 RepID=UPI0007FE87A7|nr:FAD-dependent oxidoreductase [Mycobacterium sp. E1747]OBH11136.1 hypothetical protein A5695_20225 [Mycobacterium sp. E1747]